MTDFLRMAGLAGGALMAASALVACGGGSSSKTATQVAVKVNKDEISVHQINQQISRLPANLPEEQRTEATKRVLTGLVDQQLFVQEAIAKKLDRDPEVVSLIETQRQQLLAQAYVQKYLSAQAKPSEQEIKKYYNENPALFGERKLYRLQELNVSATPAQVVELGERVQKAKNLQDIAAWLRDNKIPFDANSASRAAEQLPLPALPQLAKMQDGQVTVFKVDNRATVVQVVASQAQPISEKDASPVIEQFLTNRKKEELTQAEIKRLRDAGKIEYVGDFAKYSGTATPVAAKAPAAEVASGADKPADATKAQVTEKGVAGLR